MEYILFSFGSLIVGSLVGYKLGKRKVKTKDEVDRLLDEVQSCMKLTYIFDSDEIRVGKDIQLRAETYRSRAVIWYKKQAIRELTEKQKKRINHLVRFKMAEAAREQITEELMD